MGYLKLKNKTLLNCIQLDWLSEMLEVLPFILALLMAIR